jgi:hypothetical protein
MQNIDTEKRCFVFGVKSIMKTKNYWCLCSRSHLSLNLELVGSDSSPDSSRVFQKMAEDSDSPESWKSRIRRTSRNDSRRNKTQEKFASLLNWRCVKLKFIARVQTTTAKLNHFKQKNIYESLARSRLFVIRTYLIHIIIITAAYFNGNGFLPVFSRGRNWVCGLCQ